MLGLTGLTTTSLTALRSGGTIPLSTYRFGDRVWLVQELPNHPSSRFFAGVQGPDVIPPSYKLSLFTRQEQPSHPASLFRSGIQGPNVRPPIHDYFFLRQQQPDHPRSFFRPGRQGPDSRVPISDWIILRQETPWHPDSRLYPGVYTDILRPLGIFLGRQEQPSHPLWPRPILRPGIHSSPETLFGIILK